MQTLRIFISSPGDVTEERQIAGKVIERLQGKYWSFVRLDDVFWEQKVIRSTAHYQDELVNPGECEMVVGILWSRLGSLMPEKFRKSTGERFQSGTEWELEMAFDAYEQSLARTGDPAAAKPDIVIYRRNQPRPRFEHPDQEALAAEQITKLDAYFRDNFWFPDGTIKRPITHYDTLEEFEEKLLRNLEELILRQIPGLKPGFEPPPISGSPFKGLQAFDFADSDRYFGRNREIRDIQQRLAASARGGLPFILIYGGSGYGKSSLMRAGLAPVLTRSGGSLDEIQGWRRVSFQPAKGSGNLCQRLARVLIQAPTPEESEHKIQHWPLSGLPELTEARADGTAWDAESLARHFSDDELRTSAVDAVADTLESLNCHLLLEIDQLEEMFTTPGIESDQRSAFLRTVGDLCLSGRVWGVATMRSEFFPRVAEQAELFALVGKERGYILTPPDRQSLREIIRYPVLAARLDYERRMGEISIAGEPAKYEYLDDQILSDAESSPDALPLLEFTLEQLYENRRGTLLTWEAYAAAGGLKGAIARRAREVYDSLDPLAREARHRIFAALVHVDAARNTVTRQRAPLEILRGAPGADDFLQAFLGNHLLVTDEDALTGEAIVTLAHEALLSHWDELATWIKDHRGDLLARQRLAEQTNLWQQNERKKSYLLSEARLAEAQRVAARGLFSLSPGEDKFLAISEQRSRTKTRILKTAVAVFALLAVVAAGFGWMARQQTIRANKESERAAIGEKNAHEQKELAIASQKAAEKRHYIAGIQAAATEISSGRADAARRTLLSLPKDQRRIEWAFLMEWAGPPMIRIKDLKDWMKRNEEQQPYLVRQIREAENNLSDEKDDAGTTTLVSPNMLFTAKIAGQAGSIGAYGSVVIRDQFPLRAPFAIDACSPVEDFDLTPAIEISGPYGAFDKAAFTPDSSILLIEASAINEYASPPVFNPGDDEGEYYLVPVPYRVLPYMTREDVDFIFTLFHGHEIVASAARGESWIWDWPAGGQSKAGAVEFDFSPSRRHLPIDDEVFQVQRVNVDILPSHLRPVVQKLLRHNPEGPRRILADIKYGDESAEALFILVEDTALLERWDLISDTLIGRLGQGISAPNVLVGNYDWGAAYSPDGNQIIACPVASKEGRLVAGIFDLETGELKQELPGMEFEEHGEEARPHFGFSPDGSLVYASIFGNSVSAGGVEINDPSNQIFVSKKLGKEFGRAEVMTKGKFPRFLAWSPSGTWRFEVNDNTEILEVVSTSDGSRFPLANAVRTTPCSIFGDFRNRTELIDGRYIMGDFVFIDESPEPILRLPIAAVNSKFRSAVLRNPNGGFDVVTGCLDRQDETQEIPASMALLKWWVASSDLMQ